jgi:hypothetical protein
MDRLISQAQHPEVVALLRDCQSHPPSLDYQASRVAFKDALRRLERGGLVGRREALKAAIHEAFPSQPERCAELREELQTVQTRLLELNVPKSEGVH